MKYEYFLVVMAIMTMLMMMSGDVREFLFSQLSFNIS